MGIFLALDKSGYGIFCLLACICHETAHLIVLIAEKNPPREIIFSGGGICIKQRWNPSVAALSAGCLVNFLLFAVFFLPNQRENIYPLLFGGANLCIGVINLLPIGELDGKKLLSGILNRLCPPASAEKILHVTETVFSVLTAAAIVFMIAKNFNLTAVLILLYIFLIDFLQNKR